MSEYTLGVEGMGDFLYFYRPDKTTISSLAVLDELNALLARAEKAEAALENRELVLAQMQSALNATYAETHHPDIGAAERKPMMPHERIAWLGEDRDNWEARAKAAEAKLAQFWSSPSCSPEIVQCSQKSSLSQPTKVETISALQAATTSIPVTTESVVPDWQRVRIDAAIAALEGMLACRGGGDAIERAKVATEYADALITELKKEKAE